MKWWPRRERSGGGDGPSLPAGGQSWFASWASSTGDWAGSRPAEPEDVHSAFSRIFRMFLSARAGLSVVLGLAMGLSGTMAGGSGSGLWLFLASAAYALSCLLVWFRAPRMAAREIVIQGIHTPMRGLSSSQWLATVGVDMLGLCALHLLAPSSNLNYLALLLVPVLMAGVLTPRLWALGTSAGVALLLLGLAVLKGWREGDLPFLLTQAGLSGGGLFLASLLVIELSSRLAREELAARGSRELAVQQAQLNRLVIEEMNEGVMVVDRRGRVRAINPAARALIVPLGLAPTAPFQLQGHPDWAALVGTVERAFLEGHWPAQGRDVQLSFEGDTPRTLRLRVRFTQRPELALGRSASEELCVLWLEDLHTVQARWRQDKLAAMGRLSAAVAHEIRNPLSAITQANALLAEDELPPAQRRLVQLVADNALRLKRIVDDVMALAPGGSGQAQFLAVEPSVRSVCDQWLLAQGLGPQAASVLTLEAVAPVGGSPSDLHAGFEPDALARVLMNLLDNAYRHCNKAAGSVRVRWGQALVALDTSPPAAHGSSLSVQIVVGSNGEPISPEVQRHLFEPFFSTRSRGTGLGLFICRELCERFGARIDYRQRPAGEPNRNEFIISMPWRPSGSRLDARTELT
jgi:two-component system sensor histidine kinase PilS (NtrC family)